MSPLLGAHCDVFTGLCFGWIGVVSMVKKRALPMGAPLAAEKSSGRRAAAAETYERPFLRTHFE